MKKHGKSRKSPILPNLYPYFPMGWPYFSAWTPHLYQQVLGPLLLGKVPSRAFEQFTLAVTALRWSQGTHQAG